MDSGNYNSINSTKSNIKSISCSYNKIVFIKYDTNKQTNSIETTADTILQTIIPNSWISLKKNAHQFLN